jgi:hypothetical protein
MSRLELNGIQLPSTLGLYQIIRTSDELPAADAALHFFRGFPAKWPLIQAGVPVQRTILKERLPDILNQASTSKAGIQIFVVTGAKAVGKTTTSMQLAYALAAAGHTVAWRTYPRQLNSRSLSECTRLLVGGKRLHVFGELRMHSAVGIQDSASALSRIVEDFADFIRPVPKDAKLTLYLEAESNQFAVMEAEFREACSSLSCSCKEIPIPLNLTGPETKELAFKLTEWRALGSLAGKSAEDICRVFESKANRILLVALLEATLGSEDENFHHILKREYEELAQELRIPYELVAMVHSFGIATPLSLVNSVLLMGRSHNRLGLTRSQLRAELRGVIDTSERDLLTTRHPLVAQALCDALAGDSGALTEAMWLERMCDVTQTINEHNEAHREYVDDFASAKVPRLLRGTLEEFAEHILHRCNDLSAVHRAALLNSVARCFQSRREYASAIKWADQAWAVWQDPLNAANVILSYCYLSSRNEIEAVRLAEGLAKTTASSWHALHGILILCKAGQAPTARELLRFAPPELRSLTAFGRLKRDVELANITPDAVPVNPWVRSQWIERRLQFGQMQTWEAVERLEALLREQPNVHAALAQCCHLLLLEKEFKRLLSLAKSVYDTCGNEVTRDESGKKICPNETKSMAVATMAWARFRRDGLQSGPECEVLFRHSLNLHAGNAWAHNWFGVVEHLLNFGCDAAQQHVRTAISCDRNIPPFYCNLSHMLIDTNWRPFSRTRNREVISLCGKGLSLCPGESYWNWGGLRNKLWQLHSIATDYERRLKDGATLMPSALHGLVSAIDD